LLGLADAAVAVLVLFPGAKDRDSAIWMRHRLFFRAILHGPRKAPRPSLSRSALPMGHKVKRPA